MKANVPEKIYFTQTENGTYYYTEGVPSERNHIEYTRTDAFIEKACEKLKQLMYDSLMYQGRLERDKVIDNFIENFKERIKGE